MSGASRAPQRATEWERLTKSVRSAATAARDVAREERRGPTERAELLRQTSAYVTKRYRRPLPAVSQGASAVSGVGCQTEKSMAGA